MGKTQIKEEIEMKNIFKPMLIRIGLTITALISLIMIMVIDGDPARFWPLLVTSIPLALLLYKYISILSNIYYVVDTYRANTQDIAISTSEKTCNLLNLMLFMVSSGRRYKSSLKNPLTFRALLETNELIQSDETKKILVVILGSGDTSVWQTLYNLLKSTHLDINPNELLSILDKVELDEAIEVEGASQAIGKEVAKLLGEKADKQ